MNLKVRIVLTLAGLCMALMLSACASTVTTPVPTKLPASTIQVDPALLPSTGALPPLADGVPRPVSALIDEHGNQVDFVENELVLFSSDEAAITAFVSRWNGKILKRTDPPKGNPHKLESIYHVRVDADGADPTQLASLLAKVQPDARNDLKLSTPAGLKLLTVAAQERASGLNVALNYLSQPQDHVKRFDDLSSTEAISANGNIGVSYSPNAFDWPYMSGPPQNINVTDAWRMLERAGKINSNGSSTGAVRIAIIDGGFCDSAIRGTLCNTDQGNQDFGPLTVDSDEFRLVNVVQCGGGNACPWHGTNVAMAAAALPDNGFGAAGSAGPVARIMLYRRSELATGGDAIFEAIDDDARIINMSYSARFPASVAWVAASFDLVTAIANAYDVLLFAAAGNDGVTVDDEDCFAGTCWEDAFHSPCENAGVICVGGLKDASTRPAGNSNFGHEDVDLWGPFQMYVGFDPAAPPGIVNQAKFGTSFSSPFVGGVAALIWAADPSLRDDQVEKILLDTAHKIEPCIGTIKCVPHKIVNASGAVRRALKNIPPDVSITMPQPGTTMDVMESVNLNAVAHDFNGGCCTYSWRSNKEQGVLGTASAFAQTFHQLGTHTVTVTATDDTGLADTETVDVTVTNKPPTADIVTPLGSDVVYAGSTEVAFKGEGFDQGTGFGGPMDCTKLSWRSNRPTDVLGSGCAFSTTFAAQGWHTIVLTATDGFGSKGTDSVTFKVGKLPKSGPPVINITRPDEGTHFDATDQIRLSYTRSDPGATPTSQYTEVWKYRKVGGSATEHVITPKLCQSGNPPAVLLNSKCFTPAQYGITNSGVVITDLILFVTDPEGFTATDKVQIMIGQVP